MGVFEFSDDELDDAAEGDDDEQDAMSDSDSDFRRTLTKTPTTTWIKSVSISLNRCTMTSRRMRREFFVSRVNVFAICFAAAV